MDKIGVIGLGNMGRPLSLKLSKIAPLSFVFDKNTEDTGLDCRYLKSLDEIKKAPPIIVMSLPNVAASRDTLSSLAALSGVKIVIDHSTVDADFCRAVEQDISSQLYSFSYINAPFIGGPKAFERGDLVSLLPQQTEHFHLSRQLLRKYSKVIQIDGKNEAASNAKLMHNYVTIMNSFVCMQALHFSRSLPIDSRKMLEIIQSGTARSYIADNTINNLLSKNDYQSGYKVGIALKDIRLMKRLFSEIPELIENIIEIEKYFVQHINNSGSTSDPYPAAFLRH